ncbi:uncharacterized protein [Miscanthus floridulus]|uniref:uncharacterized protein n=1 Tax=Miscanthus floridulus TaxID=154761 RepID=UPI0034579EB7
MMMPGVPHHQGSASLSKYKKAYEAAHGGQPIGQLTAYALAHMGPAKSNIEYNPDAGPEAYTNSSVHTCPSSYMEASRLVPGPDYDPRTGECLDPERVMRTGQGKKHGQFYIGDGILDMGSTPLNRLRAASTSSSVPISQRPTAVAALQAEVQQLRAQQEAQLAEREAKRAEREAERQRIQALEAQQEGLLKFVQQLGQQQGWEIPAQLLAPPSPPHHRESTPHQSGAASNHVRGSPASHVGPSPPRHSPGSHPGASQPS